MGGSEWVRHVTYKPINRLALFLDRTRRDGLGMTVTLYTSFVKELNTLAKSSTTATITSTTVRRPSRASPHDRHHHNHHTRHHHPTVITTTITLAITTPTAITTANDAPTPTTSS